MAPKIVPLIPPHTVYCEPFAGGAAVFYAKPLPACTNKDHYREVLNDLNGDLVNMYRVAKRQPGDFSASLQSIPFSLALYHGKSSGYLRDEEKALSFFMNAQVSFAHRLGQGFGRGTYGENWANSFCSAKRRALEASNRLDKVVLDSVHAVEFIKKWDSPHTFFYIDPPYLGTKTDGMGRWEEDCLAQLVEVLNKCRGSYILSSYDLHGNSLTHSKSVRFLAHCSASGVGKTTKTRNHGEPVKSEKRDRTERLYMRGPTVPVRSKLIPVLEKQTCFTGPLLGPCPLPLKTHPSANKSAGTIRNESRQACAE